jgi:hypothetical protein
MKTIIELCQSLPDSEPELRSRAGEFNEAVALLLEPKPEPITARQLRERVGMDEWYSTEIVLSDRGLWGAEIGTDHNLDSQGVFDLARDDVNVVWKTNCDAMDDIADAKAATDALLKLGARSLEIYCRDAEAYCCGVLVRNLSCGYAKWVAVCTEASTEEAARSACALLAANALKGGE